MPRRARPTPVAIDPPSTIALAVLVLLFALGTTIRGMPRWIGWLYLLASGACFAAYAIDKSAAIARRRRISEAALLWLGALGGWPGAILAQQLLRHKTAKHGFRLRFRLSVAANVVTLACVELLAH